jgi:hypothetical protein
MQISGNRSPMLNFLKTAGKGYSPVAEKLLSTPCFW